MLKPRQYGRYILIDRISTGGMAEVYLAKSSGLQGFEKVVAIKRILPTVSEDPDFETMFIDEAKISARLAHSNIGQVFEFGQVDGQYYISMEYIPGKDLRSIQTQLEETDRTMEVPAALHIVSRLCQALDYAHRQKDAEGRSMEIIHRDISPPNVIVSFEGAIKLIDFGIAKATSRSTRTRAGKLKGKFAYMSPEQVQGLNIDHRSDVFSVGTLLHELLTNQRLFQGESQLAVMQAVRRAEVAPPSTINPEVPLEVDKITLRALARDPDQRYSWASELRADIERHFARAGVVYDSPQLARWMQSEFAGDILAEQRLQERLHALSAETVAPPADQVGDAEVIAGAEIVGDIGDAGDATATDGAPVEELPDTDGQPVLPTGDEVGDGETVRHVLDTDRRELDTDRRTLEDASDDERRPTDRDMGIDPAGLAMAPGGPDTDRHRVAEERGDLIAVDGQPEPEEADTGMDPQPRVIGPSERKDRRELVNWPTQFNESQETAAPPQEIDAGPTRIEPAPPQIHDHAIAPGPDRDGATVGGALEVDSNPDRDMSGYPSDPAVDVAGVDGAISTSEIELPPDRGGGDPVSGTREVGEHRAKRFSSVHVIIIAAGLTLLLAGLFSVPMLVCGNDDDGAEPGATGHGTIVVSTRPPASCSVGLDTRPRGLLAPGETLSLPRVPAGPHQVQLTCAGFEAYSTVVEVRQTEVTFVEAPLKKE